jgi:hypothetical protein
MFSSWIVVPDGLAADARGRALPEPSFVYRAVLEWVAREAGAADRIYLAPANPFGGDVTEQEAGRRYLTPLTSAAIVCPPTIGDGYVDTRGNAIQLRRELVHTDRWPLPPANLVAYAVHLPRSVEAFSQEGFAIARAHAVGPVPIDRASAGTRIVRRLWYYRYPALHRVYERLALGMTRRRII